MSSGDSAPSPYSWLCGVWEAVDAVETYPTTETTQYNEIMEFRAKDQPVKGSRVLEYNSETWHAVKKHSLHSERGYLYVDPDKGKLAFLIAHFFGAVEIAEGEISDGQTLRLESTTVPQMSFSTVVDIKKIIRSWELKGDELHLEVFMETATTPLQLHLKSRYRKKK